MDKTVIARAPVRIGFAGGGTDLPSYYEQFGGLAVSATISYYVYVILTPSHLDGVQVIYADHQAFCRLADPEDLLWNSDLCLPKAIVYHFNIRDGLTVFLASQVPPGSGLGLCGSVAVSMIKALAFCCGLDLGPKEVAELACYVEIDKLGMPVGRQDQYAAAFGGLNCITFSKSGVVVEPLCLLPKTHKALEEGLMLLFSGASHHSLATLHGQRQAGRQEDEATMRRLGTIKQLGIEIRAALESGDLEAFGDLLHRSWMEERELTPGLTNPTLDQCYQLARENGALGGKVTDAGSGGFLMLYCPKERQDAVTEAATALGLQRWPFALEREGVQVMQLVPWSRQPMMSAMPWSQLSVPQGISRVPHTSA